MLNIRPYTQDDVYDIELDYEFGQTSRAGLLGHDNIVAYTLLDDDKVLAVGGAHVISRHPLPVMQNVCLVVYCEILI